MAVRGSKAFRRAMPEQKPLKWPPRYANHRRMGGARTGGARKASAVVLQDGGGAA